MLKPPSAPQIQHTELHLDMGTGAKDDKPCHVSHWDKTIVFNFNVVVMLLF